MGESRESCLLHRVPSPHGGFIAEGRGMLGTCARQFPHTYNLRYVKLEHQVPGWVRGGSRDERVWILGRLTAFEGDV
jgi:hypothetical protein